MSLKEQVESVWFNLRALENDPERGIEIKVANTAWLSAVGFSPEDFNPEEVKFGENRYYPKRYRLIGWDGREHALSTKERRLLEYMLARPGQVLTRERVLLDVFDYRGESRTADNVVLKLRKMVEPEWGAALLADFDGHRRPVYRHIRTEHGAGWIFRT